MGRDLRSEVQVAAGHTFIPGRKQSRHAVPPPPTIPIYGTHFLWLSPNRRSDISASVERGSGSAREESQGRVSHLLAPGSRGVPLSSLSVPLSEKETCEPEPSLSADSCHDPARQSWPRPCPGFFHPPTGPHTHIQKDVSAGAGKLIHETLRHYSGPSVRIPTYRLASSLAMDVLGAPALSSPDPACTQLLYCSVGGYLCSVITRLRLDSGDEGVRLQLVRTASVFITIAGHLAKQQKQPLNRQRRQGCRVCVATWPQCGGSLPGLGRPGGPQRLARTEQPGEMR